MTAFLAGRLPRRPIPSWLWPVLLAGAIGACGRKGDLYLPPPPEAGAGKTSSVSAPVSPPSGGDPAITRPGTEPR